MYMKTKKRRISTRGGGKDGKSCTNFCSKTFKKDFVKRYLKQFKEVIKNKNLPVKVVPRLPSEELLKKMNMLCLGNYCNRGCKGFDTLQSNLKNLYKEENVRNDFHKNISKRDLEKLQKQGVFSTCVNPEDFYNTIFPHVPPPPNVWEEFKEKYLKN